MKLWISPVLFPLSLSNKKYLQKEFFKNQALSRMLPELQAMSSKNDNDNHFPRYSILIDNIKLIYLFTHNVEKFYQHMCQF